MPRWFLEPGHTSAEFRARHMMVTWVRGAFKNVSGWLEFDPAAPEHGSVEVVIDARTLWTGDAERDEHLRSADFLDVERCPRIEFRSSAVRPLGPHDLAVDGEMTIRCVTRPITLQVRYLGQWTTPWWEDGTDKGPVQRAGFAAEALIDRRAFGVSWNAQLDRGGVVVGDEVFLSIDAEAILEDGRVGPRRE